MKRFFFALLIILSSILVFTACKEDKHPEYYTVHFDSNGSVTYQSRAIEKGAYIVEPKAPTRVGYEFRGWYVGAEKWDFSTDTVEANITLKAEWERVIHTVKFDSNGGTEVSDQTIASGDFASEPPAPTRKNYKFLGWFYNNRPWSFDTDRVRDLITLTAEWEQYPTYTVTFDTKGGTEVENQYIILGEKLSTPKATTKANSKFVGWYYNGVLWDFSENTISSDITLTAKWEPIVTYTVTFNSNGGAEVENQYVIQGSCATEVQPATPNGRPGVFLGWYDESGAKWDFSRVVTGHITLTAKWTWLVSVSFVVQYPGDTSYTETSVYIDENTTISSTIVPSVSNRETCKFIGWVTADGRSFNFDTKVTGDLVLKADFEMRPNVTFVVQYPGEESNVLSSIYVDKNTTISASAMPTVANRETCKFIGWVTTDGNDFDLSTKISADTVLEAKWSYAVNFVIQYPDEDVTSVTTVYVDENTAIPSDKIPTVANKTGSVFKFWTAENNAEFDFNSKITSSITLKTYMLRTYTVTFIITGVTNDTLIAAWKPITVEEGSLLEIPKIPSNITNMDVRKCTVNDAEWNFEVDRVYSDIEMTVNVWAYLEPVPPKSDGTTLPEDKWQ